MSKHGLSRHRIAGIAVAAAALFVLPAGPPPTAESAQVGGVELTTPVLQSLDGLRAAWRAWTRAFFEQDRGAGDAAIEEISTLAAQLGMRHASDYAAAASVQALVAGREGHFERARWALEAARRLDAERPEIEFAAARLALLQDDYTGAVVATLHGHLRLLRWPRARQAVLLNAGLWGLYSLLLAGVAWVVVMAIAHGSALFYDLGRVVSPPLPRLVADLLTLAFLLSPLLLPGGVLWLVLLWSVVLWGYGSISERLVWIGLWVLLGAAPMLLAFEQRAAAAVLAPPARLLDNLQSQRLYGAMLSDLQVLESSLPGDPRVGELIADVHRRFGQWEHARAIYDGLIASGDLEARAQAPALTNLGVYYQRRAEYGTAMSFFKRAGQADPTLAVAFFDLSQAYNQLYEFADAHQALARAKELDRDRIDALAARNLPPEESTVGADGALLRTGGIPRDPRAAGDEPLSMSLIDLWRRHVSLSIAVGLILTALAIHGLRSHFGYRSRGFAPLARPPLRGRWTRALIPGLTSARQGHGVRGVLAVWLPIALLTLPLVRAYGYRLPIALDAGTWLVWTFVIGALILWMLVRLGEALRE